MSARLSLVATTLALALGGPHSAAVAADDQAASPPSVDDVILILRGKEDAIETLQVTCLCLDEVNRVKPGTKFNVALADNTVSMSHRSQIVWEVRREGAVRMLQKTQCTNTRHDGTTFGSRETVLFVSDDGALGRYRMTDRQFNGVAQPDVAQQTKSFNHTHVGPFDFTARHRGTSISKLLTQGDAKFIETQLWDERPVVVVEAKSKVVNDSYILRNRFWIDVDRGVAVRRQSFLQRGKSKPWGLEYQMDATQYSEASPGIWLPGKVDTLRYWVFDQDQDFLANKERYAMTGWIVNQKIDASRFDINSPDAASLR